MLLASFLKMAMGLLGQGPLSTLAIVSAILCSFSFEVFVRVSTEVKVLEHAGFIVKAAHICDSAGPAASKWWVVRLASHRQQHLLSHRRPE